MPSEETLFSFMLLSSTIFEIRKLEYLRYPSYYEPKKMESAYKMQNYYFLKFFLDNVY